MISSCHMIFESNDICTSHVQVVKSQLPSQSLDPSTIIPNLHSVCILLYFFSFHLPLDSSLKSANKNGNFQKLEESGRQALPAVNVVRRQLEAGRLLALVGGVSLVRLVELCEELDLGHQAVHLRQHGVVHCQLGGVVPDLDKEYSSRRGHHSDWRQSR